MLLLLLLVPLLIGIAIATAVKRRNRAAPPPLESGSDVGWSSDADWRVVSQMARVEIRRLLLHPAFVAGVVVTPLMLVAAIGSETTGLRASTGLALGMVPLGWMTIVATDLVVLRSRRSRTEELFVSLPAPNSVRTSGFLLLTPVVFVVAVLILVLGGSAAVALMGEQFVGNFHVLEIAAGALIVAGGAALGVAVARWLPHAVWGIVAMFASLFLQARFLDTTTWPWNSTQADLRRFLGFLAATTSAPPALEVRRPGWHLVYLVGLVLLVAVVALARHGWQQRLVGGGLAVALAVIVVAAVVQTRPPLSGEVDVMVAFLEDPGSQQTCTTHGAVTYCVYRDTDEDLIGEWRSRVEAVLAVVPVDPGRSLEVRQRPPAVVGQSDCLPSPFVEALPQEVVARIHPERVWPADGNVHPGIVADAFGCSGGERLGTAHNLFVAVQAGAWAVELPPAPRGADVRCAADGQARAVLALWLGAQATPDGAGLLRRTISEGSGGSHLTFPEWDERPVWGVTYSIGDAETALDVLAKPRDEVISVVRANYELLVSPSTPTKVFRELVGVTTEYPPPSPSGAEACR